MTPPSSCHHILQFYKEAKRTPHHHILPPHNTTRKYADPGSQKATPPGFDTRRVWFEARRFTLYGAAAPDGPSARPECRPQCCAHTCVLLARAPTFISMTIAWTRAWPHNSKSKTKRKIKLRWTTPLQTQTARWTNTFPDTTNNPGGSQQCLEHNQVDRTIAGQQTHQTQMDHSMARQKPGSNPH